MSLNLGQLGLAALCAAALCAVRAPAGAAEGSAWSAVRQARFAAFRAAPGPAELWDAPEAPPLVIVPAGEFEMGPGSTPGGQTGPAAPGRRVRIPQSLAVTKYPVTVGEYAAFVAATGHPTGPSCWTFEDEDGHIRAGRSWRNPGFPQADTHPVLCVGYDDVQAYIAWLSARTGHAWRLLSEAEYEYVNRAGAATAWWWGDEAGANHANCDGCGSLWDNRRTSPVGSFAANGFGLYDTAGNTWVWTSDCYVDAKTPLGPGGACTEHVIKGGAWHGLPAGLRALSRFHHTPDTHSATLGIRLARAP